MNSVRTINDFNREYMYSLWKDEVKAAEKTGQGSFIRDAAFYVILTSLVMLAFFYNGNREPGKRFGPFSYNTVLTNSMQSVYPQGSLITSWAVKPAEPLNAGLENGTDIVFIRDNGDVVVHRIIEIIDNYEDSGQRAFKTQGVDNPAPDSWTTYEGNVIGRVTWHVPYVGNFFSMIAENLLWIILFLVIIFAIITLLKIVFEKEEPTPQGYPADLPADNKKNKKNIQRKEDLS